MGCERSRNLVSMRYSGTRLDGAVQMASPCVSGITIPHLLIIAMSRAMKLTRVPRHYSTNDILSQDLNHHVPDRRHHFARMHRAKLQQALLKHLPNSVLHVGKKTASVETDEHGATVRFEDGTCARADIVIGADGIRSVSSCCPKKKLKDH